MKQIYLDGIILRVIEESGNDPDIREDFVRRVLMNQLKRVVPGSFFPIKSEVLEVKNGTIVLDNEYISVIAVDKPDKKDIPFLYLYDEKVYEPFESASVESRDIEGMGRVNKLGAYRFSEDVLNSGVVVSTDQTHVSVFYYSPYSDANGRSVVPEFATDYLTSYGTMRVFEVLLNKGLRGRTPVSVPQTRYTLQDIRKKVTNEYISMQRTINLLVDKVIIKPVNSDGDVSTF